MNSIRTAAYFQFAVGILAIVLGVVGGGVAMWPFLLIGLVLLASGGLTYMS